MNLIWFAIFGLIVGLIARAVMPGKQPMGWIATALVGMAGSFVGGFLYELLFSGRGGRGFIGSLVGAMLLLWVGNKLNDKRS